MNMYLSSTIHQIRIAMDSVIEMMEQLNETELTTCPISGKRTYQELLAHISLICHADLLIMKEATIEEMNSFYESHSLHRAAEMKEALKRSYQVLVDAFSHYSEAELNEVKTSYWGVSYTRYEWLLEILCHLNHHRSQLHTWMSISGREPKVQLFE